MADIYCMVPRRCSLVKVREDGESLHLGIVELLLEMLIQHALGHLESCGKAMAYQVGEACCTHA
jgi:hypothetical protein